MTKIGLSIFFLMLIAGRVFLQAHLMWGMGSEGAKYFGSVIAVESTCLAAIVLASIYCLRDSKWPSWLVMVPAVLTMFSSPVLFKFGGWWAKQGWQLSEVVDLMNVANFGLCIVLVAFACAPRITAASNAAD